MAVYISSWKAYVDGTLDAGRLLVFDWVPDAGTSTLLYDPGAASSSTRKSTAEGTVVFVGQAASDAFSAVPIDFSFSFTNHEPVGTWALKDPVAWSWTPDTGVLDPKGAGGVLEDGRDWWRYEAARFTVTSAQHERDWSPWGVSPGVMEHGYWQIRPGPSDYNLDALSDTTIIGAAGNETLDGSVGSERLSGGDGNDRLNSDGYNLAGHQDTLEGGTGNDTADGRFGDDLIHLGDGHDLASGGSGNDLLLGGLGRDTLAGFFGDDLLLGEEGDDVLQPGGGNDTLAGGAGWDTLDMCEYAYGGEISPVGAEVDLSSGRIGRAGAPARGSIVLTGVEGVIGTRHDDMLAGDSGANALDGAGGGTDTLTGGGGADHFMLGRGQTLALDLAGRPIGTLSRDIIADFSAAEGDRVDLHLFGAAARGATLLQTAAGVEVKLADAAGGLHAVALLQGATAEAMGQGWIIG